MNARFKPGQGTFSCRSCHRLTRDVGNDNGGVELCEFCYERMGAENTLSDSGDSLPESDRETLQRYIASMAAKAIAKGGTIAGYASPAAAPGEPAAPAKAPARGRPFKAPSERLEPITMRLTPARRAKLQRLGRDWLARAIDKAREEPKTPASLPTE
jgi:hypothetical protein